MTHSLKTNVMHAPLLKVRVDSQFDSISKKEHDMELMIDNLAHNLQDADMHVHEAEP